MAEFDPMKAMDPVAQADARADARIAELEAEVAGYKERAQKAEAWQAALEIEVAGHQKWADKALDSLWLYAGRAAKAEAERDAALAQVAGAYAAATAARSRLEAIANQMMAGTRDGGMIGGRELSRSLVGVFADMDALATNDATAALDRMLLDAERKGQIKAGGVFADTNPEAQWIKDGENACPACGGSGHKDDAAPSIERIKRAERNKARRELAKVIPKAIEDKGKWLIGAHTLRDRILATIEPEDMDPDHAAASGKLIPAQISGAQGNAEPEDGA